MKDDKVVIKRLEGREELYNLFSQTVEKMRCEDEESKLTDSLLH
jgi:hypothetical protein